MKSTAGVDARRSEPNRRERALLWLALIGVALMPSVYRGGAETPHPHSFFQFWGDPAEAFAHHDSHGDAPSLSAHESDRPTGPIVTSRCDAIGDVVAFVCTASGAGFASLRDIVRISPMTAPGGIVDLFLVICAAVTVAFVLSHQLRRVVIDDIARLGFAVVPDAPPPRILFSCANVRNSKITA